MSHMLMSHVTHMSCRYVVVIRVGHVTHMNGSCHTYEWVTHSTGMNKRGTRGIYKKQKVAGIMHTIVIHVPVICVRVIHIYTYRVGEGACGLLRTHTNTRRLHMDTYPVALQQWSRAQDTED